MIRVPLLKLRHLAATYGRPLAVVLAVVGVLALGNAVWVYANPPTTEVTDHEHRQSVESSLHTSAVVTGNTTLYDRGQRLRDRSTYLLSAAPNLSISLRTDVPADQAVTVDQRLTLLIQARNDGEVFWRERRPIAADETTIEDGRAVTNGTVDVRAVRERIREVSQEVGSAGTVRAAVRFNVSYETDRYSGSVSETAPLSIAGETYGLDRPTAERSHSTPVTREAEVPRRDRLPYLSSGAVGLLALLAAGFVVRAGRESPERTRRRLHRARYDEWVSAGRLPHELGKSHVRVDSLEDLVDVAIDAGRRVVHDPGRDMYAVVDDGVVYYYGEIDDWIRAGDPDRADDADTTDFVWDDGEG